MNTPKSSMIGQLAGELAALQRADARKVAKTGKHLTNQEQAQVIKRTTKKST